MNTTRKEIIEIIEPYMDKTWTDWCLVDATWSNEIWDWWIYDFVNWIEVPEYEEIIKTWWHYDITAVLKYIGERKYSYIDINRIEIFDSFIDCENDMRCWEIPNKPLHLYTEQQEKDLLKILKELWTQ